MYPARFVFFFFQNVGTRPTFYSISWALSSFEITLSLPGGIAAVHFVPATVTERLPEAM